MFQNWRNDVTEYQRTEILQRFYIVIKATGRSIETSYFQNMLRPSLLMTALIYCLSDTTAAQNFNKTNVTIEAPTMAFNAGITQAGTDRLTAPGCFELVWNSIGKMGVASDQITKSDEEVMELCELLHRLSLERQLYRVELHFNRNNYVKMETKILIDCDEC